MIGEIRCPDYQAPRALYIAEIDDYVEGAAMCGLVDKPCLVEHGDPKDCDYYMEYLKEVEND